MRITLFGDMALLVEDGPAIDAAVNARILASVSWCGERACLACATWSQRSHRLPCISIRSARTSPSCVRSSPASSTIFPPQMWRHIGTPSRSRSATAVVSARISPPSRPGAAGGPSTWSPLTSPASTACSWLASCPGFPYLASVDERIAMPRRDTPRPHVAAGSVGIAGRQTGVYPFDSPGGWQIIGRTPLQLFDPHRGPPALFSAGQRVRFRPITPSDFDAARRAGAPGEPGRASPRAAHDGPGSRQMGLPICWRHRWRAHGRLVTSSGERHAGQCDGRRRPGGHRHGPPPRVRGRHAARDYRGAVCDSGGGPLVAIAPRAPGGGRHRRRLRRVSGGNRAYIAVTGGLQVPMVLGSRSTDLRGAFGGYAGRALRAGDRPRARRALWASAGPRVARGRDRSARATPSRRSGSMPGPQEDDAMDRVFSELLRGPFRISSRSDRMGYRLEGRNLAAPTHRNDNHRPDYDRPRAGAAVRRADPAHGGSTDDWRLRTGRGGDRS